MNHLNNLSEFYKFIYCSISKTIKSIKDLYRSKKKYREDLIFIKRRIELMSKAGYTLSCIGLKKENNYYVTELVHYCKEDPSEVNKNKLKDYITAEIFTE
jgi:hypothetical protein